MRVLRVGQHALLVECRDPAEVAASYRMLCERSASLAASDIVPAARSVLIDGLPDPAAAAALIAAWEPSPDPAGQPGGGAGPGRLVEVPTTYDGPDLDEVARQWQLSTAEVIGLHQATEFRVAFCGFAPGFAYCTGLDAALNVARRAEPRVRVPPGSVALAGEYTGVYPTASPGGWQLIGRTSALLWVAERDRPALLVPGDRVRFVDG